MPNYKKILGAAGALGATGLGGYAFGGSRGMEIGQKKGLQQGYQMGRRDAMMRQQEMHPAGPSPTPEVQPPKQPSQPQEKEMPEPEGADLEEPQQKSASNRFFKAAKGRSSEDLLGDAGALAGFGAGVTPGRIGGEMLRSRTRLPGRYVVPAGIAAGAVGGAIGGRQLGERGGEKMKEEIKEHRAENPDANYVTNTEKNASNRFSKRANPKVRDDPKKRTGLMLGGVAASPFASAAGSELGARAGEPIGRAAGRLGQGNKTLLDVDNDLSSLDAALNQDKTDELLDQRNAIMNGESVPKNPGRVEDMADFGRRSGRVGGAIAGLGGVAYGVDKLLDQKDPMKTASDNRFVKAAGPGQQRVEERDISPRFRPVRNKIRKRLPRGKSEGIRAMQLPEVARKVKRDIEKRRREKMKRHRQGDTETSGERMARAIPQGILATGAGAAAGGAAGGPAGAAIGGLGAGAGYAAYETSKGPRQISSPDDTGLSGKALAAQKINERISNDPHAKGRLAQELVRVDDENEETESSNDKEQEARGKSMEPNSQEKNATMNRFLNAAGKTSTSDQTEGENRFLKSAAPDVPSKKQEGQIAFSDPAAGLMAIPTGGMLGPTVNTARDSRSKGVGRSMGDAGSRFGYSALGGIAGGAGGAAAGGLTGGLIGAGAGAIAGGREAGMLGAAAGAGAGAGLGGLGGYGYGLYQGAQKGRESVDQKYNEQGEVKPDEVMLGKNNDGNTAGDAEKEASILPLAQSAIHGPRPNIQMPSAPQGERARMIMMRIPRRGINRAKPQKEPDGQEGVPHEMKEEDGQQPGETAEPEEKAESEGSSNEKSESDSESQNQSEDDGSEDDGSEEKSEEESEESDGEVPKQLQEGEEKEAGKNCPHCGAEITDEGKCPKCGEDVSKEAGFVPAGTHDGLAYDWVQKHADEKTADDSDGDSSGGNPCWDGYEQAGMKTKNGKKVPNCIPKESHLQKKLAGTYAMAFDEAGERSVPNYLTVDPNQDAEEKIASALNRDLIGEDDAMELMAMKEAFDQEVEDLEKEAMPSMPGANKMMAAGLLAPPAMMAANKAIDPVRERIRYERMKRLPGKSIRLGDEQRGGLDNARENWNVPKDAPRDEAVEKARRRAFGILHDQAPEVTRSPSVARGMIRRQLKGGEPQRLMEEAQDLGGNAAKAKKDRQKVQKGQGRALSDAAQALRQDKKDVKQMEQTDQQMRQTEQQMQDKARQARG